MRENGVSSVRMLKGQDVVNSNKRNDAAGSRFIEAPLSTIFGVQVTSRDGHWTKHARFILG